VPPNAPSVRAESGWTSYAPLGASPTRGDR
jgi:hypothetical protein